MHSGNANKHFKKYSSKSSIVHHLYILGTKECRLGLEKTDPRNILCVKNCTFSDPIHGESVITFGEKMNLKRTLGYQWTNSQVERETFFLIES